MLSLLPGADFNYGPLLATFLLGFTTLVLLLIYSIRKQSYWKRVGIPCVDAVPFIGSILDNLKKPLHFTDVDRAKRYGRIYGYYEGNRPLLSIADPEILRQLMVKDFFSFTGRRNFNTGDKITENMISTLNGEDWKRVRTIVTPTFTTGKIKRMMGIFKECSQTLMQNFKQAAEKGDAVVVHELFGAFSMDVVASAAFSTKIDSHNDPKNIFIKNARLAFSPNISWRFVLFTICPGLLRLFRIPIFSPTAIKFFKDVTLQIIEERKKTGQTRNDFLQLLIDTAEELREEINVEENEKDDIAENYKTDENDQESKPITFTKKTLSQNELIAQCVIFFLAGYHTTAYALSFATYCLALNPDVQKKLIKELDDALAENDGELTYEAIQKMKYLDNVISETLRMYPPAVRIERVADEDYTLSDHGLTIPKGVVVTVPVYAIHRDPELYPDAEKFDPDRFTPEERAKRNQYAFIPFGHGPRNCVGMRFALMEIKVCLAHVLSNYRIKRSSKTKVPLDFHIGQGLLMPKEITLALEVRKDTVKAL